MHTYVAKLNVGFLDLKFKVILRDGKIYETGFFSNGTVRSIRMSKNDESKANPRETYIILVPISKGSTALKTGMATPYLLPRCYQDRTNSPHQDPGRDHPVLLFLVGLGCLRLDCVKFVNRRSTRSCSGHGFGRDYQSISLIPINHIQRVRASVPDMAFPSLHCSLVHPVWQSD